MNSSDVVIVFCCSCFSCLTVIMDVDSCDSSTAECDMDSLWVVDAE